jgi:hypothetical protein
MASLSDRAGLTGNTGISVEGRHWKLYSRSVQPLSASSLRPCGHSAPTSRLISEQNWTLHGEFERERLKAGMVKVRRTRKHVGRPALRKFQPTAVQAGHVANAWQAPYPQRTDWQGQRFAPHAGDKGGGSAGPLLVLVGRFWFPQGNVRFILPLPPFCWLGGLHSCRSKPLKVL